MAFEFTYHVPPDDLRRVLPVLDHVADAALPDVALYGWTHTSVGAGGTITLSLPPAVKGMNAIFRVGAAQELRLDPSGAETIALPSTGVAGAV